MVRLIPEGMLRHGPRRRITSVLNRPITDSAIRVIACLEAQEVVAMTRDVMRSDNRRS